MNKKCSYSLIIITLIFIATFLIYKEKTHSRNNFKQDQVLFINADEITYDSAKKYYQEINYNQYKKIIKKKKNNCIAIADNSLNTSQKFKELINKLSYEYKENLFLLERSKLTKKNEIEFLELDEKLNELEANYIICINNKKIISTTIFNEEELNTYINGIS